MAGLHASVAIQLPQSTNLVFFLSSSCYLNVHFAKLCTVFPHSHAWQCLAIVGIGYTSGMDEHLPLPVICESETWHFFTLWHTTEMQEVLLDSTV